MSAKRNVEPAERPLRSGWCGKGLPPESHERCTGSVVGHPCPCECHESTPDGLGDDRVDFLAQAEAQVLAQEREVGFEDARSRAIELVLRRAREWDGIADSSEVEVVYAELLADLAELKP